MKNIDLSYYNVLNPYKVVVLVTRPHCECCDGTPFARTHHFLITWGITSMPEPVPEPEHVEIVRNDNLNIVTAVIGEC